MNHVRIAAVTPTETARAAEILARYLRATDQFASRRQVQAEVEQCVNGASKMWIALSDERVVGCVIVSTLDRPRAFELRRMFVLPSQRRRGLATVLLRAAESFVASKGGAWMYLETHASMHEARGLYAAHGFSPTQPYRSGSACNIWLRKRLDGADADAPPVSVL